MSSYFERLFKDSDVESVISTEGMRVGGKDAIKKLKKSGVGMVIVFCRRYLEGLEMIEVKVLEAIKRGDLKRIKEELENPAENIFIIKSSSRFIQSLLRDIPRKPFTSERRPLLCEVSY